MSFGVWFGGGNKGKEMREGRSGMKKSVREREREIGKPRLERVYTVASEWTRGERYETQWKTSSLHVSLVSYVYIPAKHCEYFSNYFFTTVNVYFKPGRL